MELLAAVLALLPTAARAQWLNYPAPGAPRTRDGKLNLAAKAPRAPNGKPDLSGVWQAEYAPLGENERLFGDVFKDFVVPGDDPRTFSKYFLNILADFKPEEAPLRPEAAALFRKNSKGGTGRVHRRAVFRKVFRAATLIIIFLLRSFKRRQ